MKPKRAEQGPEESDGTNQKGAMKKIVEIKFCEERRDVSGAPEKRRGEEGAADYDCAKVSEEFGGIFQGR
jgi:hypothetical protein